MSLTCSAILGSLIQNSFSNILHLSTNETYAKSLNTLKKWVTIGNYTSIGGTGNLCLVREDLILCKLLLAEESIENFMSGQKCNPGNKGKGSTSM